MRKKTILLFLCALTAAILLTPFSSSGKEIHFDASVEKSNITLGQGSQLNLKFQGTTGMPSPDLPRIDGFKTDYLGPSTVMSIVNGRMTSSVTHIYRLIPLKTGKFKIGPLTFKYKGDTYISNELTIEVVDRASARTTPSQRSQTGEIEFGDRVFVEMRAKKLKAYVNENIPLTIKLYIGGLGLRDIEYPQIDFDGFSASAFGKPRQYKENRSGITYDVVEFNTLIFATKPGILNIGPAKIGADVIVQKQRRRGPSPFGNFFGHDPFEDFFGQYESEPIALKSKKLSFKVLPLPEEDRPADFNGAVGDFRMDLKVSPVDIKVGDPVTVKMIITGKGNFSTVTAPVLEKDKRFKTYEPRTKQEKNQKIFEQVMIPSTDSVNQIPTVSFSFFNTETEKYQTIVKKGISLKVAKPEKKEEPLILISPKTTEKPAVKEKFGRDIIYIKETPGALKEKYVYLYKNSLFLLFQIVPLLALLSVWLLQERRKKLAADVKYARRLAAPRKARKGIKRTERMLNSDSTATFYDAVFSTLREYLGDRFYRPAAGITADMVDDMLCSGKIDAESGERLKDLFHECDTARYASAEIDQSKKEKSLTALKELIDKLERIK